jgi:hypothetical protein
MSRFQELIAAAMRVCELDDQGAPPVALSAAVGRLRTAMNTARQPGEQSIGVFSGVGMKTGEGFVELSGSELPATLPAAAAAQLGLHLVEAAATAQTEAALLAELRAMDIDTAQIGALLAAMRKRRDKE